MQIKQLSTTDFKAALGSSGPSSERPTNPQRFSKYFDTDLDEEIYFDGVWKKAANTTPSTDSGNSITLGADGGHYLSLDGGSF